MSDKLYSVGTRSESWKISGAQTVTFIVTDDCNLRCKYCYITHKSAEKKMSLETAKKYVDYMLSADMSYSEAVILEFIGGEPMLEAELISQICDYFKVQAYKAQHKWYWNYRISICTNGVNYTSEPVQRLISRNSGKISVTITIDGTREKHDLQRVFPDGSGSYDMIAQGIPTWLSTFPGATKVTFASDDLPLLKDSVISLWDKGVSEVNSNVVFEDVWKEGDDQILYDQLISLADYVVDNDLHNSGNMCSFFDATIGFPYTDNDKYTTYCGAGKMLAFSADGDIYPCLRYYGHSLNNHKDWPIGSLEKGIDMDRVRPFMVATTNIQSDSECLNCEIASGCAFCQGFNYDQAETPTNFHRAKYICKMHKARVRANEYYFARLKNKFGIERQEAREHKKSLYILMSEDYVSYCCYKNTVVKRSDMPRETLLDALAYSRENFFRPVLVHSKCTLDTLADVKNQLQGYDILHLVPGDKYTAAKNAGFAEVMPVFNMDNIVKISGVDSCILSVPQNDILLLAQCVCSIFEFCPRINLYISAMDKGFDEARYEQELKAIKDYIVKRAEKTGVVCEITTLTDAIFNKKHDNCKAGENHFTVSPQGQLFTCPGMYSAKSDEEIGNISEGITRKYDARLYKVENHPLCAQCPADQCHDCVHINLTTTSEVNVSPAHQCRKSLIEYNLSCELKEQLEKMEIGKQLPLEKEMDKIDGLDPITAFFEKSGGLIGFYSYKK